MDNHHWLRTNDPASEPVTTAEARLQCRFDGSSNDTFLGQAIAAARTRCEETTGRALITQTWTMTLDDWPYRSHLDGQDRHAIFLPRPPVQSVTSVSYVDEDGDTQVLATSAYRVHLGDPVTRITPAYGTTWPTIRKVTGAITIVSEHGYGDASTDVPDDLRQGMLMLIEHFERNRGDEVTGTVTAKFDIRSEQLFAPYRVSGVLVG